MKLSKYLCDKLLSIIIFLICYILIIMTCIVFRVPLSLKIVITSIMFVMGIILILINYLRKKQFYDEFITNTNNLDKKYLILETISKPRFYEGEILYQNLYEINKSMYENVNKYIENVADFKDYVEMWIHEVKIPISSLVLMCHNNKENLDTKYIEQVRRLDNYIDQVLYYVRSNYTENDYIIKEVRLEKIITNVALKNKDDLLENKINFEVNLNDTCAYTDSKWLEFILNQIINNCIKYKNNEESLIKIHTEENENNIILLIYDNGIGIPKEDLSEVFKKSFTGENGRKTSKSTGMGLYIVSKLCKKLGHKIEISSEEGKYTEVKIIFGKNNFYKIES